METTNRPPGDIRRNSPGLPADHHAREPERFLSLLDGAGRLMKVSGDLEGLNAAARLGAQRLHQTGRGFVVCDLCVILMRRVTM